MLAAPIGADFDERVAPIGAAVSDVGVRVVYLPRWQAATRCCHLLRLTHRPVDVDHTAVEHLATPEGNVQEGEAPLELVILSVLTFFRLLRRLLPSSTPADCCEECSTVLEVGAPYAFVVTRIE